MLHGPDTTSTTGQLLRATIEYNALKTGCSGNPLNIPPVKYTTRSTWIHKTLYFMNKYNIRINTDIPGLEPWTQNEVFIMEILNNYGSDTTMAVLNKVRMHLRITTVSDLFTADGKEFYDKQLIQGGIQH